MDTLKFTKLLEKSPAKNDSMDNQIKFLRESGASYIETLAVLKTLTQKPLNELEDIVINSSSWISEKESINEFKNYFLDIFLSNEDDKNH